jgi:hypothetical protein
MRNLRISRLNNHQSPDHTRNLDYPCFSIIHASIPFYWHRYSEAYEYVYNLPDVFGGCVDWLSQLRHTAEYTDDVGYDNGFIC